MRAIASAVSAVSLVLLPVSSVFALDSFSYTSWAFWEGCSPAIRSGRRADAIFLVQEICYGPRHGSSNFLPGDHAQAASEFCAHDGCKNFKTTVDKILTSLIAEHSKACPMRVSSERAADELRRTVFFLCHGEPRQVEDGFQIAIAMHQVQPRGLEISFRQFGLNQEIPQLQVDFRSILRAALQGDPRSETKAGPDTRRKP